MANVVYRGPIERVPRTRSKPVTGALLPGTMVEETATALVAVTTAVAKRVLVLTNQAYKDQDNATAYTSGDTGEAYEPSPNDEFHVAMAAATYTKNEPLTVGASGRLESAGTGDVVVAHFDDAPGAYTAGQLADVVWANSYVAA